MKKETLLAIASAITAIANDMDAAPTPAADPQPEPSKRRGRPPTAATPPPALPAEEPEPEPEPAKPAAPTGAKTYEEMRELIRPLVEEGRGEEVKKVIAKYGSSLKEILADKSAAFARDIEALAY